MDDDNLIMLHGWGMNSFVFDPLQRQLTVRDMLLPALPGYPGSPWQLQFDFERQLERMAADLPPGQLLGWSLGGTYAIELAARYPHKFSALTLVACNPCFVAGEGWRCAVEASVFDAFGEALAGDRARALRRFIALQMQGEAQGRALSRSLWEGLAEAGVPDSAALGFGLELLRNHDARPALGRVSQPITLVLGQLDALVPFALIKQIADVAPAIRVESVAGAAHALIFSHPSQVAALL
ncbi:MAG: alpha/beta fold hydrolase [Gammaproteobacteria bacterium]|nr:alpha/beta fold hydrolase [Gammaproteobacteria bacterium]MDH3449299.1 alpha/beta fold hydrolase [Gammaproteobacteria bacterium]